MTASKAPGCTSVHNQHAQRNANCKRPSTHLGAVMNPPVTAADCTPLLSVAVAEIP
jgi:hypothetical protein